MVEVLIAVRNLPEAVDRYRRQFMLGAPKTIGQVSRFEGTPVVLVAGETERLQKFGEGVFSFVIAGPAGKRLAIR